MFFVWTFIIATTTKQRVTLDRTETGGHGQRERLPGLLHHESVFVELLLMLLVEDSSIEGISFDHQLLVVRVRFILPVPLDAIYTSGREKLLKY